MSDVTEAPLRITREGAVVRATLNRPERRNAMSQAMVDALDHMIAGLANDTSARVLVITGAGGHFCSGLDLTEVGPQTLTAEERLSRQLARNRGAAARFAAIAALPQVVVAQIEGSAFAGGLSFVCAADIAFASADARFCAPEVRRGLVPAQILPWLVRRMGRSAAVRMTLRADVIDAAEAGRLGLVHQVVPDAEALDAAVAAIIADIRQGAPMALAETKALIAALGPLSPAGYAEAGAQAFARCAAGPEAKEGIAAFKEKRAARWAG